MSSALLIYVFALSFFFMLSGRLMTTHTDDTRTFSTPFHCLLAGLGGWYLWFLIVCATVGASLKITWWLFALSILGLLLGMTKAFQGLREIEHFWTKAISVVLLLLPAFMWVVQDVPTQWDEFTHYMKNADHLFYLGVLPEMKEITRLGIHLPEYPLAATLMHMPVHIMANEFIPAAAAALNLILLAVAAGGLVHAANTPIRWSNLPWVTSGAVLGVTILNPFLDTKILLSGYADFPLAVALFAALFPLLRDKAIPRGWAVLPTAFILCFMMGTKEIAFYFWAFIMVAWVVRALTENPRVELRDFFGWALLAGLPLLSHLLWQNYVNGVGIGALYAGLGGQEVMWSRLPKTLWSMLVVFWRHPLATILMVGVVVAFVKAVLNLRHDEGWKGLVIQKAWYVIPALLTLYYVAGLLLAYLTEFPQGLGEQAQSFWRFLGHLQFVLLLPLWMAYFRWYENSPIKSMAYKSPWVMGLLTAALVISVQLTQERRLNQPVIAPLAHTFQVAQSLRNSDHIEWSEKVGVVDSRHSSDLYAFVMGYGLRNHAVTQPVTKWVAAAQGNLGAFHGALQEQNIGKLWVHAPDAAMRNLLKTSRLRDTHSYLFSVEEDQLRLVTSFPHPQYKVPYLK